MCGCCWTIDQGLLNILYLNAATTGVALIVVACRDGMPRTALLSVAQRRLARGQCASCGYERAGLPEKAPCPECAHTPPTRSDEPAGSLSVAAPPSVDGAPPARAPGGVARVIARAALVLAAPPVLKLLVVDDALRRLIAWSYVADGFSFEQGYRVAPLRELGALPTALGLGVALLPLAATGLLPRGWPARVPWLIALGGTGALLVSRLLGH